jgi:hypothetical protein
VLTDRSADFNRREHPALWVALAKNLWRGGVFMLTVFAAQHQFTAVTALRLADRHADAVGSSAWNVQPFGWVASR